MEHSHCHEAGNSLASLEILCILWDSKIHYGDHKGPPSVPILSQIISVHALLSSFFKKHFNITALSAHGLTIRTMLIFTMGTSPVLKLADYPSSAVSNGLLLRSLSGRRLLRPKPKDARCRGDNGRFHMAIGLTGLNNTVTPSPYAISRHAISDLLMKYKVKERTPR